MFRSLVKAVVPQAVLQPWLRRRFFATRSWRNRHWGVFDSFEAAHQYVRRHGHVAHYTLDHRQWLAERQTLLPHDYPMLFWLAQAIDQKPARIVDIGGSVGVSYLTFQTVLPYPPGLHWQVCELPEVVELGREIARERGGTQLSFTSDSAVLDGADILFSAGALQFIEQPLPELLNRLRAPPRHLLINRLPLTSCRTDFVTLQHSGQSPAPCRIANERSFIDAMTRAGYRERDHWKCLENHTRISLHPELALDYFHGFYFERNDTPSK
jgi:putative methyltransferase (TIGR04325 family)